ncbi:hypothetical protein RHMOL_Rhmol05G0246800 [Rhododendron molle]|uniref:Uncharacterized protein n=1 Tax=Rhododendron molle TaxID=49168 RepID=A0ACC0NTS6_RHOML|nr:hypothetical protein RHMOL_Rhmol05G0246800 [Rhododendron molle]
MGDLIELIINSTFLFLIPKVDGASSFNEFRPITTVACVRKILSNVLAIRFEAHLRHIIGDAQAAFI